MTRSLVPTEEEVLEGVIVEHEGVPWGNSYQYGAEYGLFGFDGSRQQTSAHYIMKEDGTIHMVAQPDQEWR